MRPRWTTTSPSYGERRWLTSRLCALGLMVEEDDAAEILAGPPMRLFTGGGRQRHCSHQYRPGPGPDPRGDSQRLPPAVLPACRARGYETWTVTTFGGSDNRLPVANGITGIVMPSAMHCRRSCQGIHFCSGDGRSDRNHGGSGIEPGLKQTGFPQF